MTFARSFFGRDFLVRDHDALRLGGPGPVHRLGAIAHGGGTEPDVLDQPEYAQAVFVGTVSTPFRYFSMTALAQGS